MEARKVHAAHGWMWIKHGYWLFRKNPLLWVVLTAIGVVGLLGVAAIPVVGDPLATLLFPVLLAGFMFGCHALAQGEELELAHLFTGFQQHTQQLVRYVVLPITMSVVASILSVVGSGILIWGGSN